MNEEIIKEDLSKNKKIAPELRKSMRIILYKNVLLIVFIILYLMLLVMAFYSMELNTLSQDLKVLSVRLFSICYSKIRKWL